MHGRLKVIDGGFWIIDQTIKTPVTEQQAWQLVKSIAEPIRPLNRWFAAKFPNGLPVTFTGERVMLRVKP